MPRVIFDDGLQNHKQTSTYLEGSENRVAAGPKKDVEVEVPEVIFEAGQKRLK